jgi:hypothetical protein
VERGEHIEVNQINWRNASRGAYSGMIARARSGKIKADPAMLARAIDQWERRQAESNCYTSGHASALRMAITITAGTSDLDARMVVLHEIGHLLAPYGTYHERAWVKIVARLYVKYGGPEIVDWAYHHERRGGDALKRRLPHDHTACQVRGLLGAIRSLQADMKEQGVA